MNNRALPQRESQVPKRIVVLGVMRSGTSLTAELVRLWGAYAGSQNELWESNISDPRGYGDMEYIPLQELNNELLDHNDRVPPLAESFDQKISNRKYQEHAKNLLQTMDDLIQKNKATEWVWKDARLPLTLPFW